MTYFFWRNPETFFKIGCRVPAGAGFLQSLDLEKARPPPNPSTYTHGPVKSAAPRREPHACETSAGSRPAAHPPSARYPS